MTRFLGARYLIDNILSQRNFVKGVRGLLLPTLNAAVAQYVEWDSQVFESSQEKWDLEKVQAVLGRLSVVMGLKIHAGQSVGRIHSC